MCWKPDFKIANRQSKHLVLRLQKLIKLLSKTQRAEMAACALSIFPVSSSYVKAICVDSMKTLIFCCSFKWRLLVPLPAPRFHPVRCLCELCSAWLRCGRPGGPAVPGGTAALGTGAPGCPQHPRCIPAAHAPRHGGSGFSPAPTGPRSPTFSARVRGARTFCRPAGTPRRPPGLVRPARGLSPRLGSAEPVRQLSVVPPVPRGLRGAPLHG